MKGKGHILSVIGGALTLAGLVLENFRREYDKQELKAEIINELKNEEDK